MERRSRFRLHRTDHAVEPQALASPGKPAKPLISKVSRTTMESQHIASPKASLLALTVCAGVFCSVAVMVLVSLGAMLVAPLFTKGHLPDGQSWPSAMALVATSFLALGLFGGSLYRRLNTKLEPEGLVVPTLRGSKLIRWSEIERVSGRGMQIKLHTSTTVVTINPLCYVRPGEVVTFLLAKIPGAGAV